MSNLYKSRDNAVVFGVLGGIGEYFNVDPVLLRVIIVVLTVMGVGAPVVIYFLLALIMPEEPRGSRQHGRPRKRQHVRSQRRDRDYREKSNPRRRREAEDVTEDDWSDF